MGFFWTGVLLGEGEERDASFYPSSEAASWEEKEDAASAAGRR